MKKVKVLVAQLCRVFTAPWNVARQPPLCMEFSRQESWSGLPCPSPGESSQPRDGTWVSCISGKHLSYQRSPGASLHSYNKLNL